MHLDTVELLTPVVTPFCYDPGRWVFFASLRVCGRLVTGHPAAWPARPVWPSGHRCGPRRLSRAAAAFRPCGGRTASPISRASPLSCIRRRAALSSTPHPESSARRQKVKFARQMSGRPSPCSGGALSTQRWSIGHRPNLWSLRRIRFEETQAFSQDGDRLYSRIAQCCP